MSLLLLAATLSLGADPAATALDIEAQRRAPLAGMQAVMGSLPQAARTVAPEIEVIEELDFPKYLRRKITFAVEDWDRLPAYLLIPKNLVAPAPAVLCLHPTSPLGKGVVVGYGEKPNRNYAMELAEQGYIALAPDYPGFGDYVATRKELYARGYVSCSMKGVWNHMRCVDLLQEMPEVDPNRIGCIGHSLGGHNTLFVGAFDPRIKALVTSCGFTSFAKYKGGDLTGWTHDGYMPRIAADYNKDPARMPFDFPALLCALAPRAVFINAPMHDDNFDVSGVEDCVRAARPCFAQTNTEEHLVVVYPDADHDFPDAAREAAYAFLDRHLRSAP
ncbi:MAG TPA: prolyl oligopeptidase family serine peptidase [Candidatus Hydrogenedentes bacterium]|nr:prolyl oligopeptidase family serine peptidase [Candidatus Hydrogenedentota bacterium]